MSDRERSPSIGDWDDAASDGEGEDGSEAGLAGLGTPPANIGSRDLQNFETKTASSAQSDLGGANSGSAGGLRAGLGATRDGGGAGSGTGSA